MLAVTNARIKNMSLLDRTALDNELKNEFGEGNYELLPVGEGFLISVNNVEYLVDKDGKVNDGNKVEVSNIENAGDLSKGGQYDGTTEETAYRITCIEDLVEWSNNYNTYKNKNIKLENSIDFCSAASYQNPKEKTIDINENGEIEDLILELTSGNGFKPIADFQGTFDGNGKIIKNIHIYTINNAALINNISWSYNGANIKNLSISGSIISTQAKAAGIVVQGRVNLYNCHNNASIKSAGSSGGIIANSEMNITNCSNTGNIFGRDSTGGIVGSGGGRITNCCNNGKIEAKNENVRIGVAGIMGWGNNVEIINCYSTGNIKGESSHVGASGIIGGFGSNNNVKNSYNIGYIFSNFIRGGYGYASGIGGNASYNCYNIGKLEATSNSVYEIIASGDIKQCYYSSSINNIAVTVQTDLVDIKNKSENEFIQLLNSYRENDEQGNLNWPQEWKKWKKGDDGNPTFE